jgi:hypothetical protein
MHVTENSVRELSEELLLASPRRCNGVWTPSNSSAGSLERSGFEPTTSLGAMHEGRLIGNRKKSATCSAFAAMD